MFKSIISNYLEKSGITVNGDDPHDIQVRNDAFYRRLLMDGSMGLGETYVDGWWDCDDLSEFINRLLKNNHGGMKRLSDVFLSLKSRYFNLQNKYLSQRVADVHYNLDNDLYQAMLGQSMAYTCAYWKDGGTLDEAQYRKYDLICQKLNIQKNDAILDLGCGFGGFAHYASSKYGCSVTCVNISKDQLEFARDLCTGLPVELHQCDYRNIETYNPRNRKFNKIVAIGLCEHIGPKNYPSWFKLIYDQLLDDGLFLLQSSGQNITKYYCDPWFDKYIFPNGTLPSVALIGKAIEGNFIMEDWHNFGPDYHKTLLVWWDKFQQYWNTMIASQGGGMTEEERRFYRMWRYYILSTSGGFKARYIQVWQILFSKGGNASTYYSVR